MTPLNPTPTTRLAEVSPEGADTFRKLREQMLQSGPLDNTTCELIVVSGFAQLGWESSFKIHARRLVRANVAKAVLQHGGHGAFGRHDRRLPGGPGAQMDRRALRRNMSRFAD